MGSITALWFTEIEAPDVIVLGFDANISSQRARQTASPEKESHPVAARNAGAPADGQVCVVASKFIFRGVIASKFNS